jgi:cytochrome c-type biogenesis protein CcsB
MNAQNDLANFSFLSLLGSMIFYWVGASFMPASGSSTLGEAQERKPNVTLVTPEGVKTANTPVKDFSYWSSLLGYYGLFLSSLLLGFLLLLRWIESGHFPLSNLYESLMFLSWSFTAIHLLLEYSIGEERFGKLLGAITTPSALLTNAFATFTLPSEMQEASPLVPALQSNWLMMHVTVMIVSYAALILGSLLSIAFLIVTGGKETSLSYSQDVDNKKTGHSPAQFFAVTLDNLSYRILGIGFPFLTIGILSGAVWANEAWGSYWSWDPKETWALLTWLIFAIYLHTRLNKGWEGKKPAMIASLGLIVVWICYLGVNLIGEGLHSYGWMSS